MRCVQCDLDLQIGDRRVIHLRCLLGIHRTVWLPVSGSNATPGPWSRPWLQVRTCSDCGRPIGRTHT